MPGPPRVMRSLVLAAVAVPAALFLCGSLDTKACWAGQVRPVRACGRPGLARRAGAVESQVAKPSDISEEDAARFQDAGYSVVSAVYGTVPPESTEDLFEVVREITQLEQQETFLKGGTFLDLGSGEGELVVNALKRYPALDRAVGVELCGDRHSVAQARAETLPDDLRARTHFIEGDICDESDAEVAEAIASARVVFIGSVMFEAGLIERLGATLRSLVARQDRSAVVISFGKQLDLGDRPSAFRSGLLRGSWGLAPIYAYGLLPS